MADKPKVIVTRRWPEAAEARLQELFDVRLNTDDRPMNADQLQQAMRDADALCPTVSDKITADVLLCDQRRVRILANFGVGYNHIDLKAAEKADLRVTNTPDVLTDCTADLTMSLILATARRTSEGERQLRAGRWSGWRPTHMLGARVTGKTIGMVGFGRIAQAVARRAHFGFGMKILFHDPYPPKPEAISDMAAENCQTLEDMLGRSDFISLHCPGGEATHHLLSRERLAMMKPGAFVINSARGDVIDEAALADALKSGALAGAGLDVYEKEPTVHADLLSLENVVLVPHLGSASKETRVAMGMRAIDNLESFFSNRTLPDRVV